MCATLSVIAGLAGPALGLSACGDDDDGKSASSTTATKPERTRTAPVPQRSAPPKVPAQVAGDVDGARKALADAGFTAKASRGGGRSLAQLQVGDTIITFYGSSADAAREGGAIKQALESAPGRGAVRVSGKRVYISAGKADERFLKVVSTAESGL